MEKIVFTHDILILGGGPSGLTAGLYAARGGKRVLLIERTGIGGQAATTYEIENYPGITQTDGYTLTQNMLQNAIQFGLETVTEEIKSLSLDTPIKQVNQYSAPIVILAVGASPRPLGLSEESRFIGQGISYCATCDGAFYRKKIVAVTGGGNTALEDALYLSKICKCVHLLHRRDRFRAGESLQKRVAENPNIQCHMSTTIAQLNGENKLESLTLQNGEILPVSGLFVAIGQIPQTEFLKNLIDLDENGYIKTNELMQTSLPNVYAAGDARQKFLRQIVTACADGAIAAEHAMTQI